MKRLLACFAILSLIMPFQALAQEAATSTAADRGFDPNLILTDEDVFDVTGMSYDRMVAFLKSHGTLADYVTKDIDGMDKTAAEIIWRVANSYKINPKYLLALLQKEQSLVEDTTPTQGQYDWAAGFGVCDSCKKDDPSIADFKGFANQMEYAAKQMRERYFLRILSDGQTRSGYAPGKSTTIDGIQVTPVNLATAALYTYTPHLHGNQNLWHIWTRWYSKHFPDGTVVRGKPSGDIALIRLGERRPFATATVAASLVDPSKIVDVSDTELAAYEVGPAINFPNYALLKTPDGKIWLIVGDERRHIKSMAAFRKFGFNMDEVEDATADDLLAYEVGTSITADTQYPQGTLLQDSTSKEVWYADSGIRHLIESPSILALYFRNRKPKIVKPTALATLTIGEPYSLHDGELVKSKTGTAVYVIELGKRRPIPSGSVFEALGWKWKNVVTLPNSLLERYAVGDDISLDAKTTQLAQAE